MNDTLLIPVPVNNITVLTNRLFLLNVRKHFPFYSKKLNLDNSKFEKKRTPLGDLGVKINYQILSKDGMILFSIDLLRAERTLDYYIEPKDIAEHKMEMLNHLHIVFRKGVTADFVIGRLNEEGAHFVKEIVYLLSETPLMFYPKTEKEEEYLKAFLENTFSQNTY